MEELNVNFELTLKNIIVKRKYKNMLVLKS